METATDQIRDLYAKAHADERQKIQQQLRDLQNDLYSDWDILFGMAMGVRASPLISLRNNKYQNC